MNKQSNWRSQFHEFALGQEIKNIIYLLIGAFIAGVAINLIYIPINITMGGVSGLAQTIHLFLGPDSFVTLGMLAMLMNIPILILGWRYYGLHMVYRSIIGAIVFSVFLDLTAKVVDGWFVLLVGNMDANPDRLIFSIFGGFLFGLGLGLIFRGHYTTGGTDILAFLAAKFIPKLSVGQFIFILDVVVISIYVGTQVLYTQDANIMSALYAFVALFLTSKVTDTILVGGNDNSQACYIISDHSEEIAQHILTDMERGVTALHGKGMYTNHEKQVLFIVLHNTQIPDLKKLVLSIDERAFLIVSDVREVAGEGFVKSELF